MDQDRAIRFAIPPFFLFASLLWGAHLAGYNLSEIVKPEAAKEWLELFAAGAVLVIPLGFLIGTISVTVLRLIALLSGIPTYEAKLSDETIGRIWKQLGMDDKNAKDKKVTNEKKLTLYVATTFDHELLATGIHTWLMRRWHSFNVSVNSIVALLLALAFAPIFSLPLRDWRWWAPTAIVALLLSLQGFVAWHETMRMIEFQSHREQKSRENNSTKNE